MHMHTFYFIRKAYESPRTSVEHNILRAGRENKTAVLAFIILKSTDVLTVFQIL